MNSSSQTTFFQQVNIGLQTQATKAKGEDLERIWASKELRECLERTIVDMEEVLEQNETLDIFATELSEMGLTMEEEEGVGFGLKGDDANVKELRTFTDLDFSKNKTLSAIDWHPTRKVMGVFEYF